MRYVRAQDVFPAEVLRLIQQYVDGQYVYIPRKEGSKRAWGEHSPGREELLRRNRAIYRDYCAGVPVEELASDYYLSEKSIRRILSQQKKPPQE